MTFSRFPCTCPSDWPQLLYHEEDGWPVTVVKHDPLRCSASSYSVRGTNKPRPGVGGAWADSIRGAGLGVCVTMATYLKLGAGKIASAFSPSNRGAATLVRPQVLTPFSGAIHG